MRPLADVEPRAVSWLWRDRFPQAMLSEIAGRPGKGKSLIAQHIAAEISKQGGAVIYVAGEDPEHEVLRPRLQHAGADLSRVHIESAMSFPADLARLEKSVIDIGPTLVVLDPIAALLNVGISRFNDSIRLVSTPLAELAERTGAGVILIDHANKHVTAGAHPLQAVGGGGSGLPAAARMVFLAGQDPRDEERIVLACVKATACETPPAIGFRLDSATFADAKGAEGSAALLLAEDGEFAFDARTLLGGEPGHKSGRPPEEREKASAWLVGYLFAADSPRSTKEVEEDARRQGITSATLRRASEDLAIIKQKAGRSWAWSLPSALREQLEAREGGTDGTGS